LRREEKERSDVGVFYIRGRKEGKKKKKRCVYYEMRDFSLFIAAFY